MCSGHGAKDGVLPCLERVPDLDEQCWLGSDLANVPISLPQATHLLCASESGSSHELPEQVDL